MLSEGYRAVQNYKDWNSSPLELCLLLNLFSHTYYFNFSLREKILTNHIPLNILI